MNGIIRNIRRFGFVLMLLLSAICVEANPIEPSEAALVRFGTIFTIVLAILMEAVCVMLLLRRRRTPRLFILWLMGMHLFTYPLFLGMLWYAQGLRPVQAAGLAEGIIILIEGGLIYLMCNLAPSAKITLPTPSIFKSLFASLAGNICSALAFPLLTSFLDVVALAR